MSNKCFSHFNGYEVKDAAARRDIASIQENVTDLDGRVDQIANDQIPEEYLQASVDQFVENNESGLATKTDLAELDSKLSSKLSSEIDALKSDLDNYNSFNLLAKLNKDELLHSGITYTVIGNKVNISGTSTANSYYTFFNDKHSLPSGFKNGEKYLYNFEHISNRLFLQIIFYDENETTIETISISNQNGIITVPVDSVGCNIRLYVQNTTTISETITVYILNALSNLELTNKIEVAEENIKYLQNGNLPQYWLEYLKNKHDSLIDCDMSVGFNGISFVFITDMHWKYNYKKSPLLIKWIQENTSNKLCVFGGDLLSNRDTRADALTDISSYKSIAKNINIDFIFGNHDLNTNGKTSDHFTDADFFAEFQKTSNNVKWESGTLCGYRDFANEKIRFIYWDYSVLDYTKLNDWISELSSDWSVIIFTHIIYNPTSASDENVEYHTQYGVPFVDNIDNIYGTTNANIIAVISGHLHRDYSSVTSSGCRIIATTCDASYSQASNYDDVNPVRTEGTTTEQAFDLFYINTDTKNIKIVRIGAGDTTSDREYTF